MSTSDGDLSGANQIAHEGPEGLLFTGDAIRQLTPDKLAAIGEFASRVFSVEMGEIRGVEQKLGEMTLEPVERDAEPVRILADDLADYAAQTTGDDLDGIVAYEWFQKSDLFAGVLDADDNELIDLRKVYERLDRL